MGRAAMRFLAFALLTAVFMAGSASAKEVASFYSKGGDCRIKKADKTVNCSKKGIYYLEEGDVLVVSSPVGIELLQDGYAVVSRKGKEGFVYELKSSEKKRSLLGSLLSLVGFGRYSYETEVGATRGAGSPEEVIKSWNPEFSLVFPDDRIDIAVSDCTGVKDGGCSGKALFILERVDGKKREVLVKKCLADRCEISFRAGDYCPAGATCSWKLRDRYGVLAEGSFYVVKDSGLKSYISMTEMKIPSVKDRKLQDAVKYGKFGYLWRFKDALLSSGVSEEELMRAAGEL
jgi:hypothetical protein